MRVTSKEDQYARDAQLVKQVREGSKDAFAQLYNIYLPLLFCFVRKYTNSDQDASDIVQGSFMDALVKMDELKDPAAFRPWLFKIGFSKAINDAQRNARRRNDIDLDDLRRVEETAVAPLLTSESVYLPEEIFEQQEIREELRRHLVHLTPLQKDMLILRYYVGLSSVAIAELLDTSQETIRKRLYDARAALQALMEQAQAEPTGEAEQELALIARLLAEDEYASEMGGDTALRHEIDSGVRSALAAELAAGALNPTVARRAQNFLGSFNFAAPSTASSVTVSAAKSMLTTWPGKIAAAALICALAGALGYGSMAFSAGRQPRPTAGVLVAEVTEPSGSAGAGRAAESAVSDALPSAAATAAAATTQAPPQANTGHAVQVALVAGGESGQDAGGVSVATPATLARQQTPPTLTVLTSTLSYPLGTNLTIARLIADSSASARSAAGARLPVTLQGFSNINTHQSGIYQVFLNVSDAQDQSAPTQILRVTIRKQQ